jgi:hypothetical protein
MRRAALVLAGALVSTGAAMAFASPASAAVTHHPKPCHHSSASSYGDYDDYNHYDHYHHRRNHRYHHGGLNVGINIGIGIGIGHN